MNEDIFDKANEIKKDINGLISWIFILEDFIKQPELRMTVSGKDGRGALFSNKNENLNLFLSKEISAAEARLKSLQLEFKSL